MGDEAVRTITGIVESPSRLDLAIMDIIDEEDISRSWVQKCIKCGLVKCNGAVMSKPSHRVSPGDRVEITIKRISTQLEPVPVSYRIVYSDQDLAVIDKPPHLVVHPAPSVKEVTLCHGLLNDFPQVRTVGSPERPGIVHRLDKDTSGLMVVALSNEAYLKLVKMISEKLVIRKYLVAVVGKVDHPFDVNAPIGRDPHNPTRMAVVQSGKSALTHFKPISVLSNNVSLLEAQLYTGRTHQIRVHLKYEGLYVLGDTVYGNSESQVLAPRVFLHSYYLRLRHPVTGEMLQFMSPLPPDLQMAWNNLGGDNIVYSAICA